jgi:hypothetical protein
LIMKAFSLFPNMICDVIGERLETKRKVNEYCGLCIISVLTESNLHPAVINTAV